ncbi:hypothetical protein A4X09_0g7584 [Tilletia walkeri]|uniref:Uncharacterized protein n=1 Tax=Tilletia walkeri TaxID=117179 RepID=A0A8X7N0I6_9BASI|nr:hypothetical protein A4X09_0g7584 [Tilletia walkeri]
MKARISNRSALVGRDIVAHSRTSIGYAHAQTQAHEDIKTFLANTHKDRSRAGRWVMTTLSRATDHSVGSRQWKRAKRSFAGVDGIGNGSRHSVAGVDGIGNGSRHSVAGVDAGIGDGIERWSLAGIDLGGRGCGRRPLADTNPGAEDY